MKQIRLVSATAAACSMLLACGGNGHHDHPTEIRFAATVGDQPAECGTTYEGLGTGGDSAELKDLRFYVSNVRLLAGGEEHPAPFLDGEDFQSDHVALVDLEDGTAGCGDSGNAIQNDTIVVDGGHEDYDGIAFDLAVPFEVNHLDLADAEPPLDVSEMFWAWAIGYRFLRVDLDVNGGDNRWNVHVGSTMCDAPSMLEPPTEECGRPNRAEIRLEGFDYETQAVTLDVAELVASSDITVNAENTAFGCQSFPDDEGECADVYPHLGMDFATGHCTEDCVNQTAFRVE